MISREILKSIYLAHGGVCAFCGCTSPARLPDGTPILDVAHISAVAPGGPRWNPEISRSQVNEESNLIILCRTHHMIIDSMSAEYPVERLMDIRATHIQRVADILRFTQGSASENLTTRTVAASRIEQALSEWQRERGNDLEEFWQRMFSSRPELLIAAAQGRAFTLDSKCYVGGKAVNNRGGNVIDFLAQHSGDAVMIEIKTPMTKLLAAEYRNGVFPPSPELTAAVAQALSYRLSILNELHTLQAHTPDLRVHAPSVFLLIGDSEREAMSEAQLRSFELFRKSVNDVVIQTYNELFDGIANLAVWMES